MKATRSTPSTSTPRRARSVILGALLCALLYFTVALGALWVTGYVPGFAAVGMWLRQRRARRKGEPDAPGLAA